MRGDIKIRLFMLSVLEPGENREWEQGSVGVSMDRASLALSSDIPHNPAPHSQ